MSYRIRKNKYDNIKKLNESLMDSSEGVTSTPISTDQKGCVQQMSCAPGHTWSQRHCNCMTYDEISGPYFKTTDQKPGPPTKKKMNEDCGCNGGGEKTSEGSYMASAQLHSISNKAEDMYNKLEKDEVLDDWVESHLAKIDQMMDSVSDSFNHDQYKHAGDMGPGGCPPGHHWCAASDSCRSDNTPQTEPLTLMGADVVSLNEQSGSSCPQRNAAGYCRIKMSPCGNNIDPLTGNVYNNSTGGATSGSNSWSGMWNGTQKLIKIGGQSPQVGMYFENPSAQAYCNQGVGINPDGSCNTTWKVAHVCAGASTGSGSCADMCGYSNPSPCPEADWNTGNCVIPSPCTSFGCTDPTALNYNSTILPNCDDNSCIPGNTVFGCMDSTASNYDPTATMDDGSCIPSCDTTPASACAQQWFQNPNATWAANWINNRDCSNYNWPSINLETQATAILNTAPNQPTIPYTFNDWNDIWGAANASGLPNTGTPNVKAQFIAKMAKAKFSQCQIQACNC